MDYFKRFLEAYQEAQLKDADESIKWAASKLHSYDEKFAEVVNGCKVKDTPFIIVSMEMIAKALRQGNKRASKAADDLEIIFSAIVEVEVEAEEQ